LGLTTVFAQNPPGSSPSANTFAEDAKHFEYNAAAPLDIKELSVETRGNATIHNITYASPSGTVSAYLVVPKASGKFAAILWGHWMMPNSPTANRREFLDEALALAPAGVVSLLIDAPQAREEFKPGPSAAILAQQVVDLRRGMDLLLSRQDVDPKRIAYVGHSWNTGTGAILDAVDKRFAAFVFMSGPQSVKELVLNSDAPRMVALRKTADLAKLAQDLQSSAWADAASYAAHLGPAPALFQYGLHDEDWVPLQDAKDYYAMSSGQKEAKFYDAGHALNAEARRDRFTFLSNHLSLSPLPQGALDSIPQTK
jgi:dienelactone hydrolase